MSKTFTFYADAGHAWLKVTLEDLRDVNLSLYNISSYSYRREDNFYLEEDMDASVFFSAYRAKHGVYPTTKGVHGKGRSIIRTYLRWNGGATFEQAAKVIKAFDYLYAKNFPVAA